MPLLHNSMKEVLRLCLPLILLIYQALKEVEIRAAGKNYIIPEGDMVLVSPSLGMRIPEILMEPNTFEPDWFGPGREEDKISPYTCMDSGGVHSCMEQNDVFVQVTNILSILFREFGLEMVSKTMLEINYEAVVVGHQGDCCVSYKRRS